MAKCDSVANEATYHNCVKMVRAVRRPADTLFRPAVISDMIKVIQFSNKDGKKLYQLYQGHPTLGGYFEDFFWAYEWCKYRNLSTKETHEMFDLRLVHYPQLRKEADNLLHRSVAKQGFGFYLDPLLVNDYSWDDKGLNQSNKLISEFLKKHGLARCKYYWED